MKHLLLLFVLFTTACSPNVTLEERPSENVEDALVWTHHEYARVMEGSKEIVVVNQSNDKVRVDYAVKYKRKDRVDGEIREDIETNFTFIEPNSEQRICDNNAYYTNGFLYFLEHKITDIKIDEKKRDKTWEEY